MEKSLHAFIQHQLRDSGIDLSSAPAAFCTLLEKIDTHLRSLDEDFAQLERSLEISSEELISINDELQQLLDAIEESYFLVDKNSKVRRFKIDPSLRSCHNTPVLSGQTLEAYLPAAIYTAMLEQREKNGIKEIVFTDNNNQAYFYEIRSTPLLNEQTLYLLFNCSDKKLRERELQSSMARLEKFNNTLVNLHKNMETSADMSELFQRVVHACHNDLAVSCASFWISHNETRELECCAIDGESSKLHSLKSKLLLNETPRFCDSISNDRAIAINNRDEALTLWGPECAKLIQGNAHSLLVAAVRRDDTLIALLWLEHLHKEHEWHNDEVHFAGSLADMLAFTFERFEKRRALEELYQSEDRFKALTETSEAAIFAFTSEFLYTNPAFENLIARTPEELKTLSPASVLGENFTRHLDKLSRGPESSTRYTKTQLEIEIISARGETRWLYETTTRSVIDNQACWLASAFDISDRKTMEARLRFQAFHDPLTGLPNKMRLLERIEACMARSSRDRFYKFTVLAINVDHFKLFNDHYGPLVGDQILLEISRRLRLCVRRGDLTARVGSDEFAILMESTLDPEEVENMTNTVQSALAEAFEINGRHSQCTASIGVVICNPGYESAEHVLRDAGIALYKAKEQGNANARFFDLKMHEQTKKSLSIEVDLRLAIANRSLELFYQPIIDLKTRKVQYLEALIRWRKNRNQIISPMDFIPLAEESGAIVPLGEWIISEALDALSLWNNHLPEPIGVSINISGKQLQSTKLLEYLQRTLISKKIKPQLVKLELTESAIIQNPETIRNTLLSFKKLGCEITIDDFGIGYSSLNYLHQLPVNSVKIDRSFIASINEGEETQEVLKAIIILCHNLKLKVVAEGLENATQLEALRALGCDMAQGFLFSMPVEMDEIEATIKQTYS